MSRNNLHNGKSLRMKVFLLNLVVVMGALSLFCSIFVQLTLSRLQHETLQSAQAALNQAGVMTEEQMQAFRNSADSLSLDEANVSLLNQNNTERYRSLVNWNQDYVLLKKRMDGLLFRSNISDVKIVTQNAISVHETASIISLNRVKDTQWYQQVTTSKSAYVWSWYSSLFADGNDSQMLIFTRNLPYEYPNYKTFYVGCVKKENFQGLLSASTADQYTSFYVVNSQNKVLLHSQTTVPKNDMQQILNWIQMRYNQSEQAISVQAVPLKDYAYFVGSQPIHNTDLKLVCISSFYAKQHDTIQKNFFTMSIIATIAMPFILLFSFLLSRSITKPLEKLRESMTIVSKGCFDVPIISPSSDREVSALTQCFNEMLCKISDLLGKQYNDGNRIKELEVKSLQAQINPHFLYNTLDLIKWKAIKYGDNDVQNLISALSEYYRKGLSKGADIVTLQSEIEHVTSYVYIQNMRFDNCVTLHCAADEGSRQCLLPKLTLQPLVENAIIHGILETESGTGNVWIKTYRKKDMLYVIVADDGCGMPVTKAQHIFDWSQFNPVTGSGYGLRNINERIQLAYGEKFGLSFTSFPQKGTEAILKLPFQVGTSRKEKWNK